MERIPCQPRPDWAARVESVGLSYHTSPEGVAYWDESAFYRFTSAEIDELEAAAYELDRMCMAAVEEIVAGGQGETVGVPAAHLDLMAESWERDEVSLVGRFDVVFDGRGEPPKLLEYNADTPTGLLEAAVVQWHWMNDVFGGAAAREAAGAGIDQFNSLNERLVEAWRAVGAMTGGSPVHVACVSSSDEDLMNAAYLQDTAAQAGLGTAMLDMAQLGWNESLAEWRGLRDEPVRMLFKLYPWEMLLAEPFSANIARAPGTRWLEPPWKALLSTKAILPVLHRMFPDSPYLLPADFRPLAAGPQVAKPMHGREGANIRMTDAAGRVMAETGGEYGGGVTVYQAMRELPDFGGRRPVIGLWMVNGTACGLGVREGDGPITTDTSRFVPHVFAG